MLTTDGSVEMDRIVRRDKLTGTESEVLAAALPYKKYYKALFLGLVDLASINANIVFNARRAHANLPKVRHVKFMKQLHLALCQLREEDWISLRSDETFQVTPRESTQITSVRQSAHIPMPNDEWRPDNNSVGRKRRTRACKVCSLLKGTDSARGGDSSVFCRKCKLPNTTKKPMAWRVFLCEKMHRAVKGHPMSCFDIWHKAWRNGTLAPAPRRDGKKRTIRARAPAGGNETSEGGEEEGEQSEVESSSGHQTKRVRRITPGEEAAD
ncbi:unnamed protein product [Phytophthora fragariaefolia]|uniref:Unnamed protein product n=1 Tax=Phytophthora fragariaefolia TaxID=1490495 RepID=A0A9W6Y1X4_9STRA|nr:unnamed protein product [Phytophthora fragariaefolia]